MNAFSAAQHELAPMYAEAREVLQANLLLDGGKTADALRVESEKRNAMAMLAIEAVENEGVERVANDQLVRDLMRPLERPVSKRPNIHALSDGQTYYMGDHDVLAAVDEQELTALQATVVNVQHTATMIIGQKIVTAGQQNGKPLIDVLFWSFKEIDGSHNHLYEARVGAFNLLAIQIEQRRARLNPLPPEVRERMWDYHVQAYIGRVGHRIKYLRNETLVEWLPKFKGNPENEQDVLAFHNNRFFTKKAVRYEDRPLGAKSKGLTNTELAEYGVFDTITRLGLAFGRLDTQQNAIVRHLEPSISSGIQAVATPKR